MQLEPMVRRYLSLLDTRRAGTPKAAIRLTLPDSSRPFTGGASDVARRRPT